MNVSDPFSIFNGKRNSQLKIFFLVVFSVLFLSLSARIEQLELQNWVSLLLYLFLTVSHTHIDLIRKCWYMKRLRSDLKMYRICGLFWIIRSVAFRWIKSAFRQYFILFRSVIVVLLTVLFHNHFLYFSVPCVAGRNCSGCFWWMNKKKTPNQRMWLLL